jgi:regulator of sigma E protease
MLSWLAPILVFGLVVFVHELGHFLAAKWAGVYAPRFSIGFGPALWRKRWGETEYIIAALPLGGYVRMASKEDESVAFIEGGTEDPAKPVESKDWDPQAMQPFGPKPVPPERHFETKSLGARLVILFAGVTMNVILALVVSTGVIAGYGKPYLAPVLDSVIAERPAARAGLAAGDSIISVDGQPVKTWEEMVDRVGAASGREIPFVLKRDNQTLTVRVTPEPTEVKDPLTGKDTLVGRVGAAPRLVVGRDAVPVGQAISEGWNWTWGSAFAIVGVVRGLFSGAVGMDNLGGPIAIARTSVEAAQSGAETLLMLVAFLSINLAVLNLLPIPVLDGGNILLNIAEAIRGKPFSTQAKSHVLRLGLVALALIFFVVMMNDIKALASSIF